MDEILEDAGEEDRSFLVDTISLASSPEFTMNESNREIESGSYST